jgi:deoxycytidylate deaminase
MAQPDFYWSDLAFSSKKPINNLKATFITAPREISAKRFRQLIAAYLPKGNLIVGIADEDFVDGFEGQPQFRTLRSESIRRTVDLVNEKAAAPYLIYLFRYAQSDLVHILEKCNFSRVVLVNGSWHYALHTTKQYYVLARRRIDYEMVSPFVDAAEARKYDEETLPLIDESADVPKTGSILSGDGMLQAAAAAARYSYDYSYQTGVAIGRSIKRASDTYSLIAASYNKVVPYQTFAMHYGAARERNYSPPHDLNHYDTVHAEVEMIIHAAEQKLDLAGTTLFINLLPCPTCARMFADTRIDEFVYSVDHSEGYAIAMLEAAGKTVRRIVQPDAL